MKVVGSHGICNILWNKDPGIFAKQYFIPKRRPVVGCCAKTRCRTWGMSDVKGMVGKTLVLFSPPFLNQWLIGGLGWWFGILGIPRSNNPFHKGILGIQTTGPQTNN